MPFSDLPDHIATPALRRVHPIPMKQDGKQMIALRDPCMLSQETVVIPQGVFQVVQLMNGDRTAEQIAETAKAPPAEFVGLLKKLDEVGLLWGPTAEQLEGETIERLRAAGHFHIRSSGDLGETPEAAGEVMAEWYAQVEDPELPEAPRAVVAPHLDYERGWPNYASAYYGWRDMDPPDRVVVLGTNHFGHGDGVVLTEFGCRTPLGTCPIDEQVLDHLRQGLGRSAFVDQIDHLPEHSIELHVPWIQDCFGEVPIVAALIPNPLVDMIADDGERTSIEQFVPAMRDALTDAGGNTCYVASADLSHVGRMFGEPRPVDEQRRFDVERHDREMMAKFVAGDSEEFVQAMRWNQNATQWCSIGNMSVLLQLLEPTTIELIDYRQACDEQGNALVSSCAMAMW